jgi:hypothetical protein
MMHIDSYHNITGWVIGLMVFNLLIIPVLFILLRNKLYPQRQRLYLITKRIQTIVAIVYVLTMIYEVNRYEHFIKFNSFGPYNSPSGKKIVPIDAPVSEDLGGRKMFTVMYQSELNGADTLALRQEALYVWQQVIVDADKQNANIVSISASGASVDNNSLNNYIFTIISRKDSSGLWKILAARALPNQALKLTE